MWCNFKFCSFNTTTMLYTSRQDLNLLIITSIKQCFQSISQSDSTSCQLSVRVVAARDLVFLVQNQIYEKRGTVECAAAPRNSTGGSSATRSAVSCWSEFPLLFVNSPSSANPKQIPTASECLWVNAVWYCLSLQNAFNKKQSKLASSGWGMKKKLLNRNRERVAPDPSPFPDTAVWKSPATGWEPLHGRWKRRNR